VTDPRPSGADAAAGQRGRRAVSVPALLALLGGCVALDQATKRIAVALLPEGRRVSLAADLVRLERVHNAGAFLGLGGALPDGVRAAIFTWGVGLLVLGALALAFQRRASARTATAAALVAGGGLGNLWDRIASGGTVVDFLNVGVGPLRTGIFNVADVAIMAGVLLLALGPRRSPPAEG
jgi:signal peptidase II